MVTHTHTHTHTHTPNAILTPKNFLRAGKNYFSWEHKSCNLKPECRIQRMMNNNIKMYTFCALSDVPQEHYP